MTRLIICWLTVYSVDKHVQNTYKLLLLVLYLFYRQKFTFDTIFHLISDTLIFELVTILKQYLIFNSSKTFMYFFTTLDGSWCRCFCGLGH